MNRLHVILVPALAALSFVKCDELKLSANPSNVVNQTTESLAVTCRAPSIDDGLSLFILLQIEQVQDDVTTSIASERLGGTVLHVQDNRTTAEAKLRADGGRSLTVTITSPEVDNTGMYQCRFAYLNMAAFSLSVMNVTNEVTFTEPDQPTPPPVVVVDDGDCACDQVWAEVKDLRETLIAENRELKKQLLQVDYCRVSFTARLSDTTRHGIWGTYPLVFDSVLNNKGEAYNVTNGIFTAPCDGQYYFRLSLRTHQDRDSGYVDGAIEVNGEEQARTSVYTSEIMDHYEQASNGLVLSLAEGDEVQVRIQTTSTGKFYPGAFSIFSGFFVSA